MLDLLQTILYEPVYNALVYLVDIVPGHDLGFAIIALTLVVKTILLPVAHKTIKSQAMMRAIEPDVKAVRDKKLEKQEEAQKIMEVYRENGVNPFSGCLLLLIQLPIIITLFLVFRNGLPSIDPALLYSFVPQPDTLHTLFLGVFELTTGSIVLALVAGATQFLQMKISLPKPPAPSSETPSFQEQFTQNMTTQMKYVLPIFIVVAAYTLSAAIALYWITNNVFSTVHELIVRRGATQTSESESKTEE